MGRNMGGSLLPSEGHDTFDIVTPHGVTFQVRAADEYDTYFLCVSGTRPIAAHPNGHSLRNLLKRMEAGDLARVEAQRQYIIDCGGLASSDRSFAYWTSGAHAEEAA